MLNRPQVKKIQTAPLPERNRATRRRSWLGSQSPCGPSAVTSAGGISASILLLDAKGREELSSVMWGEQVSGNDGISIRVREEGFTYRSGAERTSFHPRFLWPSILGDIYVVSIKSGAASY